MVVCGRRAIVLVVDHVVILGRREVVEMFSQLRVAHCFRPFVVPFLCPHKEWAVERCAKAKIMDKFSIITLLNSHIPMDRLYQANVATKRAV